MANIDSGYVHAHAECIILVLTGRLPAQPAPQHDFLAVGEKAMIRQRPRIALDAALAGREVRHGAGRRHVTGLTLLALLPCGTFEPLGIGAVDMDPEDGPLMTRSAILAFTVE